MFKNLSKTLLLTGALFLSGLYTCFGQVPNSIEWEKNIIKSSDFIIVSDDDNRKYDAYTAGRIIYSFRYKNKPDSVQVEIMVKNLFLKDGSWIRAGKVNDERLLQHEQTHFDLGELYARKLTKAFSEKKISANFKEELNKVFITYLDEMKEQQLLLDKETNHSLNRQKQEEWQNFLVEELEKHSAFADKKIIYTVQAQNQALTK